MRRYIIKNFKGFRPRLKLDRVKKLADDRFRRAGRPNIDLPSSRSSVNEALVEDSGSPR